MRRIQTRLIFPFLRFFFRHLYTDLAWCYDWVASISSMGQWWSWCRTILPKLSTGQILELGHGTGRILKEAHDRQHEVYAIDSSRQMSSLAYRRLRRYQHPQWLARARAQSLPFPNHFFSQIYTTFPSEFIFDAATLQESHRVLKQGGTLIIVGVALIRGRSVLDRLSAFLYTITGQTSEPDDDWREPLIQAGFIPSIERVELDRAEVIHFVGKKV